MVLKQRQLKHLLQLQIAHLAFLTQWHTLGPASVPKQRRHLCISVTTPCQALLLTGAEAARRLGHTFVEALIAHSLHELLHDLLAAHTADLLHQLGLVHLL